MKYLQLFPFVLLLICSRPAVAQHSEEEAVKSAIRQLFDGMKLGDSAMVKAAFYENPVLQTALTAKDGSLRLVTASLEKFLTAVGTPHTDVWDERISFSKILVDGPLASVWTPYSFYLNGKFAHCGVNSFQLFKSPKGWKIIYLVDTRRKDDCL